MAIYYTIYRNTKMEKTALRPALKWLHNNPEKIKLIHALKANYTQVYYTDGKSELISYPSRRLIDVLPHLIQLRKAYYCHPAYIAEYAHLISRRRLPFINHLKTT